MRQSSSSSTSRMVSGALFGSCAVSMTCLLFPSCGQAGRGGGRIGYHSRRRYQVLAVDRKAERAALARLALDPDGAAVGLDDALHARQPHALAGHVLHRRALAAAED